MTTYEHRSRSSLWGIILVLVGLAFLGDNLGWFEFSIWEFLWPTVLILAGLNVIMKKRRTVVVTTDFTQQTADGATRSASVSSSGSTTSSTADMLNESHFMGEVDTRVTSRQFRGGTVSTVFGGVRIECDGSELADGEQHLAINTVFGEVKLFLPAGWEYAVDSSTVFGEVEAATMRRGGIFSNVTLATPGFDTATKRLRISASTVFGEVIVRAR